MLQEKVVMLMDERVMLWVEEKRRKSRELVVYMEGGVLNPKSTKRINRAEEVSRTLMREHMDMKEEK